MRLFSNRKRPVHLGPYPQERLRRAAEPLACRPDACSPAIKGRMQSGDPPGGLTRVETEQCPLGTALASVREAFDGLREGHTAPAVAPLPRTPAACAELLRAAACFFDASITGVCRYGERWAMVIAVEPGPAPEAGNLAAEWVAGSGSEFLALRAAEIAVVLGEFIRSLGYAASAHTASSGTAPLDRLAVCAGVAVDSEAGLWNPFLGTRFGLAAVETELALAEDRPLTGRGGALAQCGWSWLVGTRGTRSLLQRWWLGRRASHLSRYPMERIRRVPAPTTRVDAAEIPQVPLRASFFNRAARGDLGAKAQAQFPNFVMKEPLSAATRSAQGALVPLQQGDPHEVTQPLEDKQANVRAVKSLGYFLGTDLIGICEAPLYTWYSHDGQGRPIEKRHRYAIVLLIDQGFETMEGASGDDWISGSQSMRAYLRGMEIATLLAAHLRQLGYAARAHSNADGQVLQIPLILHAGLGELSRIGEVVLNPFVGPRFKSAVVTTDLPLAVDEPIDFGLQDMCDKCRKCARECPCNAISWGAKVMFNGYEMWKPDVERCTRYRLTNARGAACGRCMKTCPYNHEGLLAHQWMLRLAIHVPAARSLIAALDDRLGHGRRNPVKKWWQDLEIVDGVAGPPSAGANQRDLSLHKTDPGVPVAYYNADVMPPGDHAGPWPVVRRDAVQAVRVLESPAQAHQRVAAGGEPPVHYKAGSRAVDGQPGPKHDDER